MATQQEDLNPYEQFDYADDDQALAEIQGNASEILDAMVYSFTDRRGKTVTGLSLTGVRETVREMNRRGMARIHVSDREPIINETDDHIEVKVYAVDELNGGSWWGVKRQPKRQGNFENPFALEQALSKAQRNAMYGLIPASHVVKMIESFKGAGQIQVVEGRSRPQITSGKSKQLPPPRQSYAMSREDWAHFKAWREEHGLSEEVVLRALGVSDRKELLSKYASTTLEELKEIVIDGVLELQDDDLNKPADGVEVKEEKGDDDDDVFSRREERDSPTSVD